MSDSINATTASGRTPGVAAASFRSAPAPKPAAPEPAPTPAAAGPEGVVQPEAVQRAVEQLNSRVLGSGTNLQFRMEGDLHRVVITVIDTESGEVLAEIPPEVALRLARSAREGRLNLVHLEA